MGKIAYDNDYLEQMTFLASFTALVKERVSCGRTCTITLSVAWQHYLRSDFSSATFEWNHVFNQYGGATLFESILDVFKYVFEPSSSFFKPSWAGLKAS